MREFSGSSTYYPKLNISEHQLATTIACAVVDDFRVNSNAIAGFPQILVKPIRDTKNNPIYFEIELSWRPRDTIILFKIETKQAQEEISFFYKNKKVTSKFMDFIQDKISEFEVLNSRKQTILEAHASNLIENMDMGQERLNALLELAKQNISNQEFERLAMANILARYSQNVSR